jgi:hypothetical protein buboB_18958
MDIKDIFNKIEKIEDIKKYMSDIEDGETSYLEFKGVHYNLLDKSKKKESARFRLTIAKEICAFANTDGGILIIGVDKREGVDLELNNKCENIESWADNNLTDLLEPRLHGFSVKPIEADSENRPIAIYVPQSKMAPHRVRNNYPKVLKGEKEIIDIPAEYFVRRGTKSEKLEENLVRAMYLSSGRATDFRVVPVVDRENMSKEHCEIDPQVITIRAKVFPDRYKFIKDYFFVATIRGLSKDKCIIFNREISGIMNGFSNAYTPPIFPATTSYTKNDLKIKIMPKKHENTLSNVCGDELYVDRFEDVRYLIVSFTYACEGMSAKYEEFLFISNDNWRHTDTVYFLNQEGLNENIFVDKTIRDGLEYIRKEISEVTLAKK